MQMEQDFPDIDISPNKEPLVFDFGPYLQASGLTLTGSPTVTCEVAEGVDASPSSRLFGSATLGTAPKPLGSGVSNGAVIILFQTTLPGMTYLLTASCPTNVGGVAELWGHLTSRQPT